MLVGAGLSAPPAQAGYLVTLTQQGSDVVATGSGTIDLTDLSLNSTLSFEGDFLIPLSATIVAGTGPRSVCGGRHVDMGW